MLRWVEEAETQKASGQTDDQMAAAQATFQQAEAAKLAQAKLAQKAPPGVAPAAPTQADKEAARKEQVEQTSIPATVATTWDKMPKVTEDAWTKRGEAVIKAVVAHATAHHPELDHRRPLPGRFPRGGEARPGRAGLRAAQRGGQDPGGLWLQLC